MFILRCFERDIAYSTEHTYTHAHTSPIADYLYRYTICIYNGGTWSVKRVGRVIASIYITIYKQIHLRHVKWQ